MKKLIIGIIVLVAVFGLYSVVFAATNPCGENNELCGDSSWVVRLPRITDDNYWVNVTGKDVTINFMTNQFGIGNVIVTNEKGEQKVYNQDLWCTYHEVKFSLKAGKYTVQPMYWYSNMQAKGSIRDIVVK